MGNKADHTGKHFGYLEVTQCLPSVNQKVRWLCRCKCGNETSVIAAKLVNGTTKSCGCLQRERATRHGLSRSREYQVWCDMKDRCVNSKNQYWHAYGGRGITICARWLRRGGFTNFYADMGPRPSQKHSIDRIENDGNYTPKNCRWATAGEQANNLRKNRLFTFRGETRSLSEWSRHTGINLQTLTGRIIHKQWPIGRALTQPVVAPLPYVRPPQYAWAKLRLQIYERDGWTCQVCHLLCLGPRAHICHHIVPLRHGGKSTPDNLATLCRRCHAQQEWQYGTGTYFWADQL